MGNNIVDVRISMDGLSKREIHECARGLEAVIHHDNLVRIKLNRDILELDISGGIGCWVGFDQFVAHFHIRGAWVDVENLLSTSAVHSSEECFKLGVSKIEAFMVGGKGESDSPEGVEGIIRLSDRFHCVWQRDNSIEAKFRGKGTTIGSRLLVN